MALTDSYSGIVLNQNATATAVLPWRTAPYNGQTIYQTFYLPSNYEMGSSSIEWRYPDLSGFQVMVQIDAGLAYSATLDYTLDYYVIGEGWTNLTQGTVIGAHSDGTCWFDVIFPNSVQVTSQIAGSQLRIGITGRTSVQGLANLPVTVNPDGTYVFQGYGIKANLVEGVPHPVTINNQQTFLLLQEGNVTITTQQGVSGLWYVNPTPLVPPTCEAFLADGKTPLFTNAAVALNFRILGLTADHGIDFLGNEYRSCVVQNTGNETSLNHAAVTSTESVVWTSQPQPSPFAVVSQYFDVRPGAVVPGYSAINLVVNGSAEHDGLGTQPYSWQAVSGVIPSVFAVENGWASAGSNGIRYTATLTSGLNYSYMGQTSAAYMSVSQNQTYNLAVTINVLALAPGATAAVYVMWYTNTGSLISQSSPFGVSVDTQGIRTITGSITAPATAAQAQLLVGFGGGGTGFSDMYIDSIYFGIGSTTFFDGDTPGDIWMAQPGRSGSAIPTSATAQDDTTVIDGVLVNPSTPNIAMNVYYSTDDSYTSDNMVEGDWEQKLWTRIPEVYVLTAQQNCMFPTPVSAKYIKLEYSNPQAQIYSPGTFSQPVTYKKFPTWVAEYFIAQLESPSFLASSVNVVNDAINFAYAYYLDDLDELPADPTPAPPNIIPTLTNYFNQNNYGNQVDTQTLSQINFIMQQFQLPTGSILGGNDSSLISQYASNIVNGQQLAPVSENTFVNSIDYSTVSTLNREPVVLEQSLPVMYFFLTCRHGYKEVSVEFEHNRAYFFGIQSVNFLRANYATASDTQQYIESGGDTANSLMMDFTIDADQNWYTY